MDFVNILKGLFGRGGPPPPEPIMPPPGPFPGPEDVAFARSVGHGYGTGFEQFLNGGNYYDATGSYGSLPSIGNRLKSKMEKKPDKKSQEVADYYMANYLASGRSPITGLGFEPRRTALDLEEVPKTLGGFYSPSRDVIYAALNPKDISALTHESAHRGYAKIDKKKAGSALSKADEENLVRWLMYSRMGDPEGRMGELDKRARDFAVKVYTQGTARPPESYRRDMDLIEREAARLFAARRPGGPR